MALDFSILNTNLPAQIGALPGNALAQRRQMMRQDEDRAFAREGQQMQNALARMQMTKAQADMDEEAAFKSGIQQHGATAEAIPELMKVSPTRALSLSKQLSEQQRAFIESRSKMTDLQGKKLDMYREQLTQIQTPEQMAQWYMAQRQDPDMKGFAWPTTIEDMLGQLQQAATDPRSFEQWKLKTALGMKAYMEMHKPELKTINLGGTEHIVDMNPYSNPNANGQTFQRTVSPDAQLSAETARRGQNMTDARARAQMAQADQHFQENQKLGKIPAGYRQTADGSMEAIPGGPADMKAQALAGQKAAGASDVDSAIATLRDAYDRLESGGGITSTSKGALSNISASMASSGVGQAVGRALGTTNQSARNDIAMTRPALLAALMKATGMSAKQMDSNAELKLWLATATDPTLDVESNRRALNNIERKYLPQNRPPQSSATSGEVKFLGFEK